MSQLHFPFVHTFCIRSSTKTNNMQSAFTYSTHTIAIAVHTFIYWQNRGKNTNGGNYKGRAVEAIVRVINLKKKPCNRIHFIPPKSIFLALAHPHTHIKDSFKNCVSPTMRFVFFRPLFVLILSAPYGPVPFSLVSPPRIISRSLLSVVYIF